MPPAGSRSRAPGHGVYYLIKLKHETFSKRCRSSIDIIFSLTVGVAENSWGEKFRCLGDVSLKRSLDKTLWSGHGGSGR